MPPKIFSVERKNLYLRNGAQEWWIVGENLRKIFYGRAIGGHGMRLDIAVVGDVWMKDGEGTTMHVIRKLSTCTVCAVSSTSPRITFPTSASIGTIPQRTPKAQCFFICSATRARAAWTLGTLRCVLARETSTIKISLRFSEGRSTYFNDFTVTDC